MKRSVAGRRLLLLLQTPIRTFTKWLNVFALCCPGNFISSHLTNRWLLFWHTVKRDLPEPTCSIDMLETVVALFCAQIGLYPYSITQQKPQSNQMKQTITQRKRSANALNQPRGSLEDTHHMKDQMKEAISNYNKFIFLVANKIKRNLPHHLIIRIGTKREKKGNKNYKKQCVNIHIFFLEKPLQIRKEHSIQLVRYKEVPSEM